MISRTAIAIVLMLAHNVACVTKPLKQPEVDGAHPTPAGLSMDEVAAGEPVLEPSLKPQTAKLRTPTPRPLSQAAVQGCVRVVERIVAPHKTLFAMLPPGFYAPTGGYLDALLATTPAHCDTAATRGPALAAIKEAMTRHSGRIGVILALSGPRAKQSIFILNGMRAAFHEAGLDFDKVAIVKDSAGDPRLVELRLAELLFKDRPALVVGGVETAEADALSRYAGNLLLPTIILSRDAGLARRSSFVFNVYPDERRLAATLGTAASQRGFKRYAILRPQGGKSDKLAGYFRDEVQKVGATVVHDLVYVPNDFASMQGVSRQLFKTDAPERIDEYRQAYRRARLRAEQQGVPFDPRMVVLKPIVDVDAVFIPDDFRMARHFAKLFKFHQVGKLAMIGNHEWRSPALVEPFDDFLEGSFFADFIGRYDTLPRAVSAPTVGSPYFVHPHDVVAVDFQLIGYRVGRSARAALQAPMPSRAGLNDVLRGLASDSGAFFGQGKVFDAARQSQWPTYLFNVSNGRLTLDAPVGTAARVAATVR